MDEQSRGRQSAACEKQGSKCRSDSWEETLRAELSCVFHSYSSHLKAKKKQWSLRGHASNTAHRINHEMLIKYNDTFYYNFQRGNLKFSVFSSCFVSALRVFSIQP